MCIHSNVPPIISAFVFRWHWVKAGRAPWLSDDFFERFSRMHCDAKSLGAITELRKLNNSKWPPIDFTQSSSLKFSGPSSDLSRTCLECSRPRISQAFSISSSLVSSFSNILDLGVASRKVSSKFFNLEMASSRDFSSFPDPKEASS